MMRFSRRGFLMTATGAALPWNVRGADGPKPYGALPSARQLAWHEMVVNAFLHFSVNTFTDREWGYGDEDPSIFNPAEFDADAIVAALKAGGMRGVILTCKHHDGFCLWPTQTTKHSVASSKWRDGKGDVVRDVADAARHAGLKFGVYLSPWDRNAASYGKPEYLEMYRAQLRELLTDYGEIFEVWFDGANGGDGYYGGAREKRTIDKTEYYDWLKTWSLVRSLQPGAVIFSDVGPDVRWVGNERGFANETCWETHDPVGPDGGTPAPGLVKEKELPTGTRDGSRWLPPECDVSIRPGWFWHEKENARVKTPAQLMEIYYRSVGRGGNLLLNVPPDRRGLLHANDVASLKGFGDLVRATFGENLAAKASVTASNVRSPQFAAATMLDGDRYSCWATDAGARAPEATFTLSTDATFNVIGVRENIRLGQRLDAIEVDAWTNGAWRVIAKATSIGAWRLVRLTENITTSKVRLRVTQAEAAPAISEFGLYREPAP
jgi:alpha-L-fucosidase